MNGKRMMTMGLAAAIIGGAGALAGAADPKPESAMPRMGDMPMHRGMMGSEGAMGGDMMGMMKMMHSCQRMMSGMSGAMMPHLPPGNEKLAFQMHAEMMQKMGEIAARYADRIKEAK